MPYRYTLGSGIATLAPLTDDDASEGYAINASGEIAGTSTQARGPRGNISGVHGYSALPGSADGADHAIVYTPGAGTTDIDPFGSSSHAHAIHDAGQVAGYAFTPARDYRRALVRPRRVLAV